MRKRKPIGIKRASKLMTDLGLPTPRQVKQLSSALFRPRASLDDLARKMTPEVFEILGDLATMPSIPVIDFTLIEGTGNRCGCCHQPIKAREGIAFGRPGLLGGRMPPINVCAECVKLAVIHLESAKEGLI